jgi:hypothetical protein
LEQEARIFFFIVIVVGSFVRDVKSFIGRGLGTATDAIVYFSYS